MKNLSKTFFIPLYFKYKESINDKRIYDGEAVNFFKNNPDIIKDELKDIDIDKESFERIIKRTLDIDKFLIEILSKEKIDFIFNIGCGLDFRNRRLETKNIPWYNIDLPEVIDYRKEMVSSYPNEYNISGNILEAGFWDKFPTGRGIFIFEGILMFFEKEEVYKTLKNIIEKFQNSFYIIHTFPEKELIIKSINALSKENLIKWRNSNTEILEEDLKLVYLRGENLSTEKVEKDFRINLYKN